MAEDHGDKTHPPTPHRRQKMREAGNVAQCPELTSIGILLGGLVGLVVAGGALLKFLVEMLTAYLSGWAWLGWLAHPGGSNGELVGQWNGLVFGLSKAVLPLLGVTLLCGLALALVQTGPMFLPSKLVPDFSRINPFGGLSRMISSANGVRLGFGLVRIVTVLGVAGVSLYERRGELAAAAVLDVDQLAALVWSVSLGTCVKIGLALAAVAVLDYGYQWWRYQRSLKMTTQELREEMRNLQGDPAVAARRKATRDQLAAQPLSASVARAAVIVADKAIAVALEYQDEKMSAPFMLARGAGPTARRIRDLAVKGAIPIVERPSLAAALFKEAEVHGPIPEAHWVAVAEVLATIRSGQGG